MNQKQSLTILVMVLIMGVVAIILLSSCLSYAEIEKREAEPFKTKILSQTKITISGMECTISDISLDKHPFSMLHTVCPDNSSSNTFKNVKTAVKNDCSTVAPALSQQP